LGSETLNKGQVEKKLLHNGRISKKHPIFRQRLRRKLLGKSLTKETLLGKVSSKFVIPLTGASSKAFTLRFQQLP